MGLFLRRGGHFGCPVSIVDPCPSNDSKKLSDLKSFKLTRTFILDSASVFLISTVETKGKPVNES